MPCTNECQQGRLCSCGEPPYRASDIVILLIGVLAIFLIVGI